MIFCEKRSEFVYQVDRQSQVHDLDGVVHVGVLIEVVALELDLIR